MAAAVLLCGLALAAEAAAPREKRRAVDDLGRAVDLPRSAARIVSLAPNTTEILFALGLGGRIVGTAEFSTFPKEAAAIPVVGTLAGDTERILSRRPDLVLATTEGNDRRVVETLESLGVAVWVCAPKDLATTIGSIERLGRALGRDEEARRLAADMTRRLAAVEALPRPDPAPRVAWLVWPDPPIVAGAGSFLDDLIRRAGGRNVFGETDRLWPTIGREELAARPVDILFHPSSTDSAGAFERAFAGPLGRLLPRSVRRLAVDGDRAQRPGPRLVDALEEIARRIRESPPVGVGK